jgi:flagellar biosynthesis/type III secretory pathway protein FliH
LSRDTDNLIIGSVDDAVPRLAISVEDKHVQTASGIETASSGTMSTEFIISKTTVQSEPSDDMEAQIARVRAEGYRAGYAQGLAARKSAASVLAREANEEVKEVKTSLKQEVVKPAKSVAKPVKATGGIDPFKDLLQEVFGRK